MTSRNGVTDTMAPKAAQLLLNTTTGAPADGVSPNTCSVLLLTTNAQKWPQQAVVVTATGSARLSWDHLPQTLAVVTDASGEVHFTLTDRSAESVTVTATLVGDASVTDSATSTFVAATGNRAEQPDVQPDTRANLLLMSVSSGAGADGKQTNGGLIRLVDNSGTPLTGQTLCLTCSGNALIQSAETSPQKIAVMTDANGEALINITDTVVESVLVDAVLVDDGTVTDGSNVAFTPADTTTVISDLTVSPASIPADGTTPATFTATVKDSHGNLASGATVNWSVISSQGNLTPLTSVTNGAGQASAQFTSLVAGAAQVQAVCNGSVMSTSIVVTEAVTIGLTGLTVTPGTIPADGTIQATFTATVKDNTGNPAAGEIVVWSVMSGNGSLNPTSSVTSSTGQAITQFTSTSPGTAYVQATCNGTNKQQSVEVISEIEITQLTALPPTIPADGTTQATISAAVTKNDLPVAGENVYWEVTKGHLSQNITISETSGVATTFLTSDIVGNAIVTARLENGNSISTQVIIDEYMPLCWTGLAKALNPLKHITITESGSFSVSTIPVGARLTREFSGGIAPMTFTSDNSSVASVDLEGVVTMKGKGMANISVTDSKNNSISYLIDTTTRTMLRQDGLTKQQWQEGLPTSKLIEAFFDQWGDFFNDANKCGWQGQSASDFYFWSSTGSDSDPGIPNRWAYWTVNLHEFKVDIKDWPYNYHYICKYV